MADRGDENHARHSAADNMSSEGFEASAFDGSSTGHIPRILPHERVFPVQIGCELFKLSGASISSDAPSYFSQYFLCQIKHAEENGQDAASAIRTLYIDRDPATFRDISLHLQGYHVQPRDSTHFVRLFADAQFYSRETLPCHLQALPNVSFFLSDRAADPVPKLVSQLYEESIFITVGLRQFQIPRDLFNDPGNSPNYFSLGFAAFFSSPDDLFPGLDRKGLIRPPSIVPPSVPGRSAETFAEILHLLRGYPVDIRNETHRAELLRDCRYFNLKGLEQRLIPHAISYNLARRRDEIVLRLRDILKSGIGFAPDPSLPDLLLLAGWVSYSRPYVDDRHYELVLEIGDEATRLQFYPRHPSPNYQNHHGHGSGSAGERTTAHARAEFFGETRVRMAKLLEVLAAKLNLPPAAMTALAPSGQTPLGAGNLVKVVLGPDASVVLDGRPWAGPGWEEHENGEDEEMGRDEDEDGLGFVVGAEAATMLQLARKRRRVDDAAQGAGRPEEWIVKTGQWRLRVQGARNLSLNKVAVECWLVAVKLDAYSSERARNAQRPFLGG